MSDNRSTLAANNLISLFKKQPFLRDDNFEEEDSENEEDIPVLVNVDDPIYTSINVTKWFWIKNNKIYKLLFIIVGV